MCEGFLVCFFFSLSNSRAFYDGGGLYDDSLVLQGQGMYSVCLLIINLFA